MHSLKILDYWSLLTRYTAAFRPQLVGLALGLLVVTTLQLLLPQLLGRFIDLARAGAPQERLASFGLGFIGVVLALQAATVVNSYLSNALAWGATNRLREDLVAHILELDASFHRDRTPGELIERIDGDVGNLTNFFSRFALELLGGLLLLLGILAVLCRVSLPVGLATAGFAAVALFVLARIRQWQRPLWLELRQVRTRVSGFVGEALTAREDLAANGAGGYALGRFYRLLREWWPAQRGMLVGLGASWGAPVLVFAVGDAVAFLLIARLYGAGEVTLGQAYAVFFYVALLARPIEQIRSQLQTLQQADASVGRVRELFAIQSQIADGPGVPLPGGALELEFDRVSFAYGEAPALGDLSFRLPAGRVLGLLGRTGSGKSTLARLVFRLLDPQQGEIRLGGVPVRQARLAELRARVGMVTQEIQLFAGSLRDNLTFFDPEVPDDRLWGALEELGLAGWVRAMPGGLDAPLDPQALSAGQAQLVALARLFLRDPGLVILDEASSRLDRATEALLERALDRLLAGRTAVVIAHRLSTLQRADDLVILEGGRVLEAGPRVELAADPGSRYAGLLCTGLEEATG